MPTFLRLLLLAFCAVQCAPTQPLPSNEGKYDVETKFSKAAYLADLNQLVDSIQTLHPQPYEFITQEAFEQLVAQKKSTLKASTTIGEFVWLCRSVVAAVGCGHTMVSIENVLELPPSLFFPMAVHYVGDELYVVDPLANESSVPVGTAIHSINGLDVVDLRDRLRASIPSDGYINSLRDLSLNNYFRAYCAFQLDFPKTYNIVVMDNGTPKTVKLVPSPQKTVPKHTNNNCSDPLCFEVDTTRRLGILTIRHFMYYEEQFPVFEAFIDRSFSEINRLDLEHLIIDLRNNGGGDPFCASYLLQHITNTPYRYFKKGTISFYAELQELIPPHANRFQGKPYILTNGGCASSSGHLTALIKFLDVGTFVGQETGATYSCNAFTQPFDLQHTGIFASVARGTFQVAVEDFPKDQGIQPDYPITPSLSDLLEGKDLEREKVLELLPAPNAKD